MADEGEGDTVSEVPEEGANPGRRKKDYKQPVPLHKPCNNRIEELSRPKRGDILALWQSHSHLLGPKRQAAIRALLQELYSMTPEDTEKYFQQQQDEAKRAARRKRLRAKYKKKMNAKYKQSQRDCAFGFLTMLLEKGLRYAYDHEVIPLVSPRIRNLSNMVLEGICHLRELEVPKRTNCDKLALFLIQISDWIAIALEYIYYEVQVRKNEELEAIEAMERIRQQDLAAIEGEFHPGQSTQEMSIILDQPSAVTVEEFPSAATLEVPQE